MLLSRHRELIAHFMRAGSLHTTGRSAKMLAYHMGWTDEVGRVQHLKAGKLVRPSLALWACAACGGQVETALPAACAIEWFHNATLVHDDIQDGDRTRRGRETVWSIWGVPQAINAGDAMHALAFAVAAGGQVPPERSLAAVRAIAAAALEVIEGQCLDLELEGRVEATPRMYLRMVGAKTGALLGASLQAGALLAGAAPERARVFMLAGRLLGTAFQICDDVLGMYGDPALTGKSRSGDAGRYKMTFPVIAGIRAMSALQRKRLGELFSLQNDDPETRLRCLLDEVGGETLARKAALQYAAKSADMIVRAGVDQNAYNEFQEVAHYIATRTR